MPRHAQNSLRAVLGALVLSVTIGYMGSAAARSFRPNLPSPPPTVWQHAIDSSSDVMEPVLRNVELILQSLSSYPQHRDKLVADARNMVALGLARQPDNIAMLIACAQVHEELGQSSKATACLQRAFQMLRMDPDSPALELPSQQQAEWACQAGITWAQIVWRQRKLANAEAWLRLLSSCPSQNDLAAALLPELLQTTGQFSKASQAIERTFGRATLSQLVILDREDRIAEFYTNHQASSSDIEIERFQDVLLALSRIGAESLYYQALYSEHFESPQLAQRYWRLYLSDERALFPVRAQQHLIAIAKRLAAEKDVRRKPTSARPAQVP